jgi:hypothetical protein
MGYRADVVSRDHGEAVEAEEPAAEDETSRIKDLTLRTAVDFAGHRGALRATAGRVTGVGDGDAGTRATQPINRPVASRPGHAINRIAESATASSLPMKLVARQTIKRAQLSYIHVN